MLTLRKFLTYLLLLTSNILLCQKTKFVSKEPGASIKVLKRKITDISSTSLNTNGVFNTSVIEIDAGNVNPNLTDTFFVGIDSGLHKCNTEETLVLLEKEKYKNKTQLVNLSQIRSGKWRILLEKPERLPYRNKTDARIDINKVAFKVEKKSFIQYYYESYSDYKKGNDESQNIVNREIRYNNTIFQESLERYLIKNNFIDTAHNISLGTIYKVKIDLVVKSITEHKFSTYCVVELKTLVKFPDYFGDYKELEYITFSNVAYDQSGDNELRNLDLIADALENIIPSILKDVRVKDNFIDPGLKYKNSADTLTQLLFSNTSKEAPSLENAAGAVVTITQKGSHGSGCIISNNCYIITNFHVTGVDTSEIYAIFGSGVKRRCQFIRGNPIFDLALLKVDTTIAIPLKINDSKKINIGADVYAIGTPRDISLGQSITKGIISGKRVIENNTFIQSDVSVNRGNSGGALTNKEGELIAIVNAKLVGVGVEGVSFAIPIYYLEEALKLKAVVKP